ncbi:MAG: HEAT repeat domain-containing protein [Verrucomicrobia bacterium]|nr:HEAT repeat domain-containing protein [Verrucomicrobiota bacterium]
MIDDELKPFAGPGSTEHFTRARSFDVTHVALDLRFDFDRKSVKGSVATTLAPIGKALREVELDCADTKVSKVIDEKGRTLDWELVDETLTVDLGHAVKAGQPTTFTVHFESRPSRGLYFVGPTKEYPDRPRQIWSQGAMEDNHYWFPCYDSPNEKMTQDVVMTVSEELLAISNGGLVEVKHDAQRKTKRFHWRMEQPHTTYLLTIVVGEFDVVEDAVREIPVIYYIPKGKRDEALPWLKETPRMIEFFEKATGVTYPYAKYGQVIIAEFMWGGMENTTITTLTDTALVDARARLDLEMESLVAHELSHMWYGDLITTKSWEHTWINEGFASYFDPLFFEHWRGKDEFQYRMLGTLKGYLGEASGRYKRPIVTRTFADPMDMFDGHSYAKGALALHALRYELGDELFWRAISHYSNKHAFRSIETEEFKLAVEEATGASLDRFFDQWLKSAGHPEFEVSWSYDKALKLVSVRVKQTQKTDKGTPVFRTPVDIHITTARGTEAFRVNVEKADEELHFPCATRPKLVEFDRDNWIPKTLKFEKKKDELLYEIDKAETVIGRIRACEGLGKLVGDEEAVAALGKKLKSKDYYGVRIAAAEALGAIADDAARDALYSGLSDEKARVRGAVVKALGKIKQPAVAKKLEAVFKQDKSYFVAADCVRAIARIREEDAFEFLVEALKRESHRDVIRGAVFGAWAELKDTRAFKHLRAWAESGKPQPARTAAIGALGSLARELEKSRDRDKVRNDLVELLRHENHRIQGAAIHALGELHDASVIGALEKLKEHSPLAGIRGAARRAIEKIREESGKKAPLGKLEKELGTLRDENKDLKRRLDSLERKLGELPGAHKKKTGRKRATRR